MAKNFEVKPVDEGVAIELANCIHDIDDQSLDDMFVHIAEKLGHEEAKKKFTVLSDLADTDRDEDK
jgi:hypothetical protein